jgi:hypothetical protein
MSITLSAGGDGSNDITIDNPVALQNSELTLFSLAVETVADLDKQIQALPPATAPSKLNYQSGPQSWTAGAFTFGLSGGVCGSIQVIQPGADLLTYTKTFATTIGDGLNTTANASNTAKVESGTAYFLAVELDLSLGASVAATVPALGPIGISAKGSGSTTFAVRFCKQVSGATLLKDALAQAFQGFVLPLNPQTYQSLRPGDYLFHQFDATLNLGFGATVGVNQVFLSGESKAALPGAPAAAPSATLSAEVAVNASGSLGVGFQYTNSFEALLWKTDDSTGHLHLYANHSADPSFTAGATAALILNPKVNLSTVNLSALAQQTLPGQTGVLTGQLLNGQAQSEVTAWVNDAQTKINSWLQPFQQGKTALEVTIDDLNSRMLLLDVTFNLNAVGFPSAWKQVVAGDFQAALAQSNGGMTLDPGSGLEDFHHQKTDVTFNFFGKFSAAWSSAQITNSSVIYAGSNTFNLVDRTGYQEITNVNGSGREIDLYFAVEGTNSAAGALTLQPPELHILLKATKNPKFGTAIANIISMAETGQTASQLFSQFKAAVEQGNSPQTLELIFAAGACGKVPFSTKNPDGTLANEDADTANYNAFAYSCAQMNAGSSPGNFSVNSPMDMNYDAWSAWNVACTGAVPPIPSRRDSGNLAAGLAWVNTHFGSLDANSINAYLQEASDFLNLCEDIQKLATLGAPSATNPEPSWQSVTTELGDIVHKDVPSDLLAPTAYALTKLMVMAGAQPSLAGPAQNPSPEPGITVTLRYS